jgi:hypothetical protein
MGTAHVACKKAIEFEIVETLQQCRAMTAAVGMVGNSTLCPSFRSGLGARIHGALNVVLGSEPILPHSLEV